MTTLRQETIDRYLEIIERDPKSKLFATLADAYRENNQFEDAEKILIRGLHQNPHYASGYVSLGKLKMDMHKFFDAAQVLKKASELDGENFLSLQLLGQCYLNLNQPKDALRAFKRGLFLNPKNEKVKQAVQKLESLTADEYDEDVFEMRPISQSRFVQSSAPATSAQPQRRSTDAAPQIHSTPTPRRRSTDLQGSEAPTTEAGEKTENKLTLDRYLSLIDALIVRGQWVDANEKLTEASDLFPHSPELLQKKQLLAQPDTEVESIEPLPQKEQYIVQKKIALLENILLKIRDEY